MRLKNNPCRSYWRPLLALILASAIFALNPSPASAQDLSQYFKLSYDPVTFDKSTVQGSEVFHAIISGRVTCIQPLPVSASEASLTSQVVAVNAAGGTVTLNPGYTITVKPFPARQGESAVINQSVPLQFPADAALGDYSIVGKIVQAKVKVGILPAIDVTSYLPQEQSMGTVKYTATPPAPAPAPAPAPPQPASPTPPAPGKTPTTSPQPGPAPEKSTPPESAAPPALPPAAMPPWVWLVVIVAGATTIFNIIWFLRHRYG